MSKISFNYISNNICVDTSLTFNRHTLKLRQNRCSFLIHPMVTQVERQIQKKHIYIHSMLAQRRVCDLFGAIRFWRVRFVNANFRTSYSPLAGRNIKPCYGLCLIGAIQSLFQFGSIWIAEFIVSRSDNFLSEELKPWD